MTGQGRAGWRNRRTGAFLAVAAAIPCALAGQAEAALESDPSGTANARVALIGPEVAAARIRSVVGELLAREGIAVAWSYPPHFRANDLLASTAADDESRIDAWIDFSAPDAARLYFRDGPRRRYVIRRVSRVPGLDEVAVEEIAEIVKSVVLALGSGTVAALSLVEAEAVLREKPQADPHPTPEPAAPPAPRRAWGIAAELAANLIAQRFSSQVPWSERVQVAAAGLVRGRSADGPGPRRAFGGWLAVGYTLPIQYRDAAVGLELHTAVMRVGLLWEPWRSTRASLRLGAGGGIDWVSFHARAVTSEVTAAPPNQFMTPMTSLTAAVGLDPGRRLSLALGATLDVAMAHVHYDLRNGAGTSSRVVVPFPVRPGVSVTVGWRF